MNPSSGCRFSDYSHESNCQFIVELLDTINNYQRTAGTYTSPYEWELVMGSQTACPEAANYGPLWYAHYDNVKSFDDYRQIGGWDSPIMHQYKGDTTMGGCGVDLSYY